MKTLLDKIEKLTLLHDKISPEVIKAKDIKLGLRNPDGSGVIVGITTKGSVLGYEKRLIDKEKNQFEVKPVEGKLFYCGYDAVHIVESLLEEKRFGFDETVYLLLTGELPSGSDLEHFSDELARKRALTKEERSIVMQEVHNDNQMYGLHSVVSHMSRTDPNPDSNDVRDVSRQCLNLIAKFPTVVASNYNVMRFRKGSDLRIVRPRQDLSTAENFLFMLKGEVPDEYEARIFDAALILHADHGGGNNSTFSVRVVTSSGANTYMAITAGIASLSGHLHGGANEHVMLMMKDLKKEVKNPTEAKVRSYLTKVLDKKANDRSGFIYGFGHAVYTLSDPRAIFLKYHAEKLSKVKGNEDEFALYDMVERLATELLIERKGQKICVNVDFYSGMIYKMMGIPRELYTPIFAMARVSGWAAHRLEQIVQGKIIRPAYISPSIEVKEYLPMHKR
jgi:citrate synthase